MTDDKIPPNLTEEAEVLFYMGRYDDAIKKCDEILILEPANHIILTNKGIAQERLNNFSEAIDSFNEAIKIEKGYSMPYLHLGDILFKYKNFEKSILYYNKVIELEPDNVFAVNGIAKSNFNLGYKIEAIKKLEALLEKDEFNEITNYNLGKMYFNENLFEECIQCLKKSIICADSTTSRYTTSNIRICLAYILLGDNMSAINHIEKFILKNPGNFLGLIVKGFVNGLSGDSDQAVLALEKGLKQIE